MGCPDYYLLFTVLRSLLRTILINTMPRWEKRFLVQLLLHTIKQNQKQGGRLISVSSATFNNAPVSDSLPSSTLQEAFFLLSAAIWCLAQSHRTIERRTSPSPKMKEQLLVVVQSSFQEKSLCWTLLEADHHTTKIKDGPFDLQELFGVANKTRSTYLSEHHHYHFHFGVKCCPVSESLVWGQRSWAWAPPSVRWATTRSSKHQVAKN